MRLKMVGGGGGYLTWFGPRTMRENALLVIGFFFLLSGGFKRTEKIDNSHSSTPTLNRLGRSQSDFTFSPIGLIPFFPPLSRLAIMTSGNGSGCLSDG